MFPPNPRARRALIAGMALLAVTASAGAPLLAQDDAQPDWRVATEVSPVGQNDRLFGPKAAPISVIVWLDPECPYCKLLGRTPEVVVGKNGSTANLAVRLYPLPFHGPNARLASLMALCVGDQAGSDAYYRFLDGWMERTATNGAGIGAAASPNRDPVADLAASAGAANRAQLADCTINPATEQRLEAEMHAADQAHLMGTPAIAVRNNKSGRTIMVSGAIGASDLQAAIDFMSRQGGD